MWGLQFSQKSDILFLKFCGVCIVKYWGSVFSLFCFVSYIYFWKFCQKKGAQENHFVAIFPVFWTKIFVKIYIFYPCSKIMGPNNNVWLFFSKMQFLAKNQSSNRFLWNFLSKNLYLHVQWLYLVSFPAMTKTIFTKCYKIARVAPSLSYCLVNTGMFLLRFDTDYIGWKHQA